MPKSKQAHSGRAHKPTSPVVEVTRRISQFARLLLFVQAGGRCQFDGCNEFLLEHPLTLTEGNFAQVAHIVAFSRQGPRGETRPRPVRINDDGNLMLLCPQDHKLIDDHPDRYTVAALEKHKRTRASCVRHVTGLGPDLKTTVVQLKARVAGQSVTIPIAQVTEAVAPRYPTDAKGHVIDLTDIDADGDAFVETATRVIKQRVERLYEPGMEVAHTRHISLFALAPIPLLVFLGRQLSNKVPVDVYQRHRDTEDWVWKETGPAVEYRFEQVRPGTDRSKVALLLSMSGKIRLDVLPSGIDESFAIYELTLANLQPSPTFLRTKECPLLTAEAIAGAERRGARVATSSTYASMGYSRGASALGVAAALGEVSASALDDAVICKRWDLFSRVASTSAGVELENCEILVLGNAPGAPSDLVIGHDVMADAIDAAAVRRAIAAAGVSLESGADRIIGVFAKAEAEPSGRIRNRRHTMMDDSDINHTRHARAAVAAVIASVTGDPMVYVSGGAEHQGPSGGGPVAAIARA